MVTYQFEKNVENLNKKEKELIFSFLLIKNYIMEDVKNNETANELKEILDGLYILLKNKKEYFKLYDKEDDIDAIIERYVSSKL
jgi:hypothetical protein